MIYNLHYDKSVTLYTCVNLTFVMNCANEPFDEYPKTPNDSRILGFLYEIEKSPLVIFGFAWMVSLSCNFTTDVTAHSYELMSKYYTILIFIQVRHWQNSDTKTYDDVINWKLFPRYWPFVRGIYRSPVNSPHKDQCRGALMFSLIWAWTNGWLNNRKA